MASNQGGATIVLPTGRAHAQGGARIDFGALGRPNSTTSKFHEHREWVQNELQVLLENNLTRELQDQMDSQGREFEILQTKYNTMHMQSLTGDEALFDLKSKVRSLTTEKQELHQEIENLNQEHEDMVHELSSSQHHDSDTIKKMKELRVQNRELESHLTSLQGEMDDLRSSNDKMTQKEKHLNLVIQQKNETNSRAEQLQRQVETLQHDYQQAVSERERAMNAKKDVETQLRSLQQDSQTALDTSQHYRERNSTLQARIEQLETENNEIRTRGGANRSGRGGGAGGASGAELEELRMEFEQSKADYERRIEQKDKMLHEVKNALKSLGLKIGNLDSKTAIPKLKALLSILSKQVAEYKGRQKELEHLLKARLNEINQLHRKLDKRGITL